MISELRVLIHNDLLILTILQDKGVISPSEMQERLRQSRAALAAQYGEGHEIEIVESMMHVMAENQPAQVVPFGPKPDQ
ncbi:MAG: hypothetical protein JNK21_10820 [Rhodospirillaceae bacterium]|nr:hypothetical protein [Rhodospirillaceae bacterium]